MNRRELLAVVGVTGIAATCKAGCGVPKPISHLELRVTSEKGATPFTVQEYSAPGKCIATLRSDDEHGAGLFLKRTAKDPAGPKSMYLIVAKGSTLEVVWAAVKAFKAAGVVEIGYHGWIPPGCSIPAGGGLDPTRHDGTRMKIEKLDEILAGNSIKC